MNSSILVMVAAIVIVGLILLVMIFFTRKPTGRLDRDKYQQRWLTIMNGLSDNPAAQQLAIIQADKLLDQALKERGVPGESLGERMKHGKELFSDRNNIWAAHKLRNHIAHDEKVNLSLRKTRQALNSFKTALKDIGAL